MLQVKKLLGNERRLFQGEFDGELIAAKKIKEAEKTALFNLLHLSHENLIKFRLVLEDACFFISTLIQITLFSFEFFEITILLRFRLLFYCLKMNFRGFFTEKSDIYIIMELCSKGSLERHIYSDKEVTREIFCKWGEQIVKGMSYLHLNKIVHRDLKPANILLGEDGLLKICDFGLSCRISASQSTSIKNALGTYSYMPPEMFITHHCSKKMSIHTDVWNFGVVMWEILMRVKPYARWNYYQLTEGARSKFVFDI
ncbi:unnamed protein product [Enterobius vermicularis]|uniref:mitogen-activated protein kinase kinase n=1 Tax=Enterobius vermicularis TaxID=51028 RepID=A0A3P6IF49_ENTVE|nr:unnamed protein product [Enterobius vermicularis]